jgi:threonyl-tRNA synthetase
LRVREFTQDDAHIFLRQDQLHQEILNIMEFVHDVMEIFDFKYEMEISTRPDKYIGTLEDWDKAEQVLKEVLDGQGLPYDINEGDGAFYGPKIDIKLKDAIGRKWQCATIQCDFALPERFDLYYVDSDGKRKRPVMLHRVVLGALERFIGVLIEHYGGRFPVWLSPVQIIIMNITDEQEPYVKSIQEAMVREGLRVEIDTRNEKLSLKIRDGMVKKIPYMVIAGKKEMANGTISVRVRDGGELKDIAVQDFIERVKEENLLRR